MYGLSLVAQRVENTPKGQGCCFIESLITTDDSLFLQWKWGNFLTVDDFDRASPTMLIYEPGDLKYCASPILQGLGALLTILRDSKDVFSFLLILENDEHSNSMG